ncbi:hypothetical protein P12x_004646 [Tundrisphaera lichenicola]|uniref:hypothetical protein n=1 Tax=Tundrisphaera lichenicola TaxID=2029860 RepID=UPI003EB7A330
MRYALAVFCPPVALMACRKWVQAIPSAILYALAIYTAQYGIGAVIDFFLILWAFRVVGDSRAEVEAQDFSKTVKPIPYYRS